MIDYGVVPRPSLGRTEEEEEDNEQQESFLRATKRVLDHPRLLDVTFVCEGSHEVRANRTLLASGSEYFLELFYGDMKESCVDTMIHLPSVKSDSLQVVVDYLHGRLFRWNDDGSWDIMVGAYLLADQFHVKGLCKRILRLVSILGYPSELGDLLNAAVPRQATAILDAAVKVLNTVVAFKSGSFTGWSKDSIKYCLEKVAFHQSITETILAKAVVSSAFANLHSNKKDDECHGSSMASDSMDKEMEEHLGSAGSDCMDGENGIHPEFKGCSLSVEDVGEVLRSHINLAFVSPIFLKNGIEPLGILSSKIRAAVYGVQSVCFARGMRSDSFFVMPWRSMSLAPSLIAPLATEESKVCRFYREFSVPSIWRKMLFRNVTLAAQHQRQRMGSFNKDGSWIVLGELLFVVDAARLLEQRHGWVASARVILQH
ncbi:hypothetical protein CBR_g53744 [Chara braunii]|uniref:BTB domain-containing protein n=1 Tax=Chara braunii TaxID=69332 RepID=A0A388MBH1_CHABU|nr:hypothetical protein CBR_g53744 [Chara braunii]|eukprot:GBG91853.1 hypothetical protein CBR_g53744 [Chara braunii]